MENLEGNRRVWSGCCPGICLGGLMEITESFCQNGRRFCRYANHATHEYNSRTLFLGQPVWSVQVKLLELCVRTKY
jgi:hypothetical protein